MERRTLLKHCGTTALVTPVAGCSSNSSTTEADSPTRTTAATRTASPSPRPTRLVGSEFAVDESGCGEGAERASVSFGDGTVQVNGRTTAPNDCYELFLDGVAYDRSIDELTITVASREHTAEECDPCNYVFDYGVECTFTNGPPGTVVTYHNDRRVANAES